MLIPIFLINSSRNLNKLLSNLRPVLAVSCLIALVAACGGGEGGGSSPPPSTPAPASTPPPSTPAPASTPPSRGPTISEALTNLEASGAIPTLDRSTSIPGPDANGDGVRDDMEAYINSLPDTDQQKAAMRQCSRAIGNATLLGSGSSDTATLRAASTAITNAVHCVWIVYDPDTAGDKVGDIRKFTVNTKERFIAYNQYNKMINGFVIHLPEENTCENP